MPGAAPLCPEQTSPGPTPEVAASAPEPALCQVEALVPGVTAGWCLVRPIPHCQLGFIYGLGYPCRHPEIGRIIARTQARRQSTARSKGKALVRQG